MSDQNGYWDRFWRARVSRRKLLRNAALTGAGLGAAVVVGCGGDDSDNSSGTPNKSGTPAETATPATTASPKLGGTHYLAVERSVADVLDPHKSAADAAYVWPLIGNNAVYMNGKAEVEGELIEDWEIPGDGMEMTLKVRQGVTWHNKPPTSGRPVDADDIAYNLMRIAGKAGGDPPWPRASTLSGLDSATAIDASTVSVKFKAPTSTFMAGLTDFRNSIAPKDFVEQVGFQDASKLVGSGPFIMESWENQTSAKLSKNPNYWMSGRPYLDEVEYRWVTDRTSLISSLAQGQVDYIDEPTKDERSSISSLASGSRIEAFPYPSWDHLRFNTQKDPFKDVRVRRAVHLAVDKKALADAWYGDGYWQYAAGLSSWFPESMSADDVKKLAGWNPDTRDADIQEAKSLMSAAGYADGNISFKLSPAPQGASPFQDYAVRVQGQLKNIWPSMDVTIDQAADFATWSKQQTDGNFDLIIYRILAPPDIVLDAQQTYYSTGSRNYGKFSDSTVDALIDKAFTQLGTNERAETISELQQKLIEAMPISFICTPFYLVAFGKRVQGMTNDIIAGASARFDVRKHTDEMWVS